MLEIHHVPTPVPYLWKCAAIEGNPSKGHCRVEFACPAGKVEFWVADPSFLASLTIGDYYTFGILPAYRGATTATG